MNIRRLVLADFERGVFETLQNLTKAEPLDAGKEYDIYFREFEEGHNKTHNVFVAIERDEVIGMITLLVEQKIIHSGGLVGHIEDVSVRKGWEGKGIGRSLVRHALNEARRRHCYAIVLRCKRENVPFYEKCGFREHEVSMRIDL